MKKTFLITFVLGMTFLSLSCQTKTNNKALNAENATTEVKTIHLTKAEFLSKVVNFEKNPEEWKYLGDKPAIVDFYATWCGPCKKIAPILEDLASEYDGQIYVYKVDTDQEQELASAFGITSIPSLLFIPMSGRPEMTQGLLSKLKLKDRIEQILSAK